MVWEDIANREDTHAIVRKLKDEGVNMQYRQIALVLVLDISGSMITNNNIGLLNEVLGWLKNELTKFPHATVGIQIAVITFGDSVNVIQEFTNVYNFIPPTLEASGATPMGQALEEALKMVDSRKQMYRDANIAYHRPGIILITDGEPTDMDPGDPKWIAISQEIQSKEDMRKLNFCAFGVHNANMHKLSLLSPEGRKPAKLSEGQFKELELLFAWGGCGWGWDGPSRRPDLNKIHHLPLQINIEF